MKNIFGLMMNTSAWAFPWGCERFAGDQLSQSKTWGNPGFTYLETKTAVPRIRGSGKCQNSNFYHTMQCALRVSSTMQFLLADQSFSNVGTFFCRIDAIATGISVVLTAAPFHTAVYLKPDERSVYHPCTENIENVGRAQISYLS